MAISDVPPPNVPRVLQDGQLQIGNMAIPVLISAGNHRLIVLSSEQMGKLLPGQEGVLTPAGREAIRLTLSAVDRLSMIAQYELERIVVEEPELPNP